MNRIATLNFLSIKLQKLKRLSLRHLVGHRSSKIAGPRYDSHGLSLESLDKTLSLRKNASKRIKLKNQQKPQIKRKKRQKGL